MITTGQVLSESTQTFTPILERLLEIAQEFVPYMIYIAIGALGVSLLWRAIKYILGYLKGESEQVTRRGETARYRELEKGYENEGGLYLGRKIRKNKGRTYFNS